ncbi:MAG: DUF3878 family protein [Clostridiales bacterium]|nr:DUF3878 family protein [Clostridiales bacterium]
MSSPILSTHQEDEQRAIERFPAEVRAHWPLFAAEAKIIFPKSGEASLICDFTWGQLKLNLLGIQCEPAIEGEQEDWLGDAALSLLPEGFKLSFLRWEQGEDRATIQQEVRFRGVDYQFTPFDYYTHCVINRFPADRANLQAVSWLAAVLMEKQQMMGAAALNGKEQQLFPAAQSLSQLHNAYSYKSIISVKSYAEKMAVSPEQLDEWAQRLKTEGRDKFLHKFFSALSRYQDNKTNGNARKTLSALRRARLELTTFEGRYVLHWLLSQFEQACSEYSRKPADSEKIDALISDFRSFVTERLRIDGFSGDYPHFRRMTEKNTGQLLSFAENSFYRFAAWLIVGTIEIDIDQSVQGIPFQELTAYDCQHIGKHRANYIMVCGVKNPAYEICPQDSKEAYAEAAETAKAGVEPHLAQAYRLLSGQQLTKEYKAQYGLKSNAWKNAWKLALTFLAMGLVWATVFWVAMSALGSVLAGEPYLDILLDPFIIKICYSGGLGFALIFCVLWLFIIYRAKRRNERLY